MFSLLFVGPQGRGQKHIRLLQREQHRTCQQSNQLQKSGCERKGRRGTVALNNCAKVYSVSVGLQHSFLSQFPVLQRCFSHTDKTTKVTGSAIHPFIPFLFMFYRDQLACLMSVSTAILKVGNQLAHHQVGTDGSLCQSTIVCLGGAVQHISL